ncbi:MAG: M3 family metallopeptidase [Candidatus Micrarchaeia archaeon]|jgi:thimet oligopeptidase
MELENSSNQSNSNVHSSGAPVEPIRSHYEPGEVTKICDEWISKTQSRLDAIVSLPESHQPKALFLFEDAMSDFCDAVGPLMLTGSLYPDASIAAEGSACEEKVGKFSIEVHTRKDIYEIIKKFPPQGEVEFRLYDQTVKGFELNGLNLPDDKLAQVRALKQRLSALEVKFGTNLNLDKSTIAFTKEELEGAPEDFLNRLEKNADGKYVVTMKYPDLEAVMLNAKSGETRKRMRFAFNNRGAPEENTKLLEGAVLLRQQIASTSGYASWVDYRTAMRMAKNAANVNAFIANLKPAIIRKAKSDLAAMLEFKRTFEPSASTVEWWDVPYLENQLKKTKYALDEDVVREYFPLDLVMVGMFSLFSTVFGIGFEKVENAKVWHKDVLLYSVADKQSGKILGYVYFDLFPRDGKFSHEAMNPVISGRMVNGSRNTPVAVIMANKNPATNGKPALLTHNEVEGMFHEFGHALHSTLTAAPYASLSGGNVAWDFVETPSQTLERWPWDPQVIDLLSGHYKNRSQKMPAQMRDTLIALKDLNQGYAYASLLGRSEFDVKMHEATGPVDSILLSDAVMYEYTGLGPQEGTHFPATFGHMMGGYDAGYYSYAWSRVYAIDCFAQFEKEGLFNSTTGMRYRKWILEKGDLQGGDKLLEGFLGRPANTDAFYKTLNLDVKMG